MASSIESPAKVHRREAAEGLEIRLRRAGLVGQQCPPGPTSSLFASFAMRSMPQQRNNVWGKATNAQSN